MSRDRAFHVLYDSGALIMALSVPMAVVDSSYSSINLEKFAMMFGIGVTLIFTAIIVLITPPPPEE